MSPARSMPRWTYNRGYEEISNYLASLRSNLDDQMQLKVVKQALDNHSKETELFEEIDIRFLGKESDSDLFQLQFKIRDGNGASSMRNIVDVGYGVSQSLPVIFKLIEENIPLLLLQQPEVHLHPRAQAGLDSILSSIANHNRQILVETLSAYLIDRVRMDVRDKKTELTHKHVSILFFERTGPGVEAKSIGTLQISKREQAKSTRSCQDDYLRINTESSCEKSYLPLMNNQAVKQLREYHKMRSILGIILV